MGTSRHCFLVNGGVIANDVQAKLGNHEVPNGLREMTARAIAAVIAVASLPSQTVATSGAE